jgi:AcrR family transcriptional regulator
VKFAKLAKLSGREEGIGEKREQILQGAMQVFLNQGYASTSMDQVAAAAGVSKQTIYSHFHDKEGLFTALIERVTIQRIQRELRLENLYGEPELCGKPDVLLHRLAAAFLDKLGNQEYLNLLRLIIAESVRFPELAQLYSRTVVHKGRTILSQYFRSHPELKIADPEAAAHIFAGTLVSFLLSQEILYGKQTSPLEGERVIKELVRLMLRQVD